MKTAKKSIPVRLSIMIRSTICGIVRFVLFMCCAFLTIPLFYAVNYRKLQMVIFKYGISTLAYLSIIGAFVGLYFNSNIGLLVMLGCIVLRLIEKPKALIPTSLENSRKMKK